MHSTGSGLGAKMAGGNPDPERGRADADFYATPIETTKAMVARYGEYLRGTMLWEPAAGDGAMLPFLRPLAAKLIATDIEPRGPDIMALDFFHPMLVPTNAPFLREVTAVVTNPPFMLAGRFVERMLDPDFLPELRFLALVLKGTFWHAKTRLPLFQRFTPAAVHPLTWRPDFKSLGAPTMEICWTVWIRGYNGPAYYEPMEKPA